MASAAYLKAIEPKSDQLNGDDLIGKTIVIKITGVKTLDPKKNAQPVVISYEGDNGKPYKPCKGMARLMSMMWPVDEGEWVGRRLRLYRDPDVAFGDRLTGGIRIEAASDIIPGKRYPVTIRRGVKVVVVPELIGDAPVKPKPEGQPPAENSITRLMTAIQGAGDSERLNEIWTHDATRKIRDWLLSNDTDRCDQLDDAYNAKLNSFTEGRRANDDHGESHNAIDVAPWQAKVDGWLDRLGRAELSADVTAVEVQFKAESEFLPDDVAATVQGAIDGARGRIGGGK